MKKILFFTVAAATVIALTGCSQSSDLTETAETSQTAISFDTYLAKTRAGVLGSETTETLKTNGFGVLACYTSDNYQDNSTLPNFMYNMKVTGSTTAEGATTWSYDQKRYWPNTGKISFFAYAPYVEVKKEDGTPLTDATSGITSLSNNNTNNLTIAYNLGSDITNCVDLLKGVKKGTDADRNINLTSESGIVGFTFKHALAKLNITAKASSAVDANTKITIDNVSITSTNLLQSGTLSLVTGEWLYGGGNITLSKDKTGINKDFAEVSNPEDANAIKSVKGLTTVAESLLSDNKSCYFIPLTYTQPEITISVTYWVRTFYDYLPAGANINEKYTVSKTIKFAKNFEANKQYGLNLTIGGGPKTITFDANVSEWGTDTTNPGSNLDLSVN